MSFNAFKEALKPCNANTNLSSSSSLSSFSSDSLIVPRKPPKSSLSKQLLRLQQDDDFFHQFQPKGGFTNPYNGNGNDGDSKVKEPQPPMVCKLEPSSHLGDATVYDPLLLSPPGDAPVVQVPASINSRLLEHQLHGVKFLYNLYRNNHGGILGDDMGLGKTIQIIAFLAAVYGKGLEPDSTSDKGKDFEKKGPVLIICPSSIILNWENEFSNWSTFNASVYHGPNRDLILDKLEAAGVEILITSFDTYRMQGHILSNIQWEIVVIDEAHRLKNEKSKLYTACLKIRTMKRYGLTGTIMQNKMMELFNLFDWAVPGRLGTREHFREFYDEPIKHGQRSTAPERFVTIANERKHHLVSVLKKYMLRRTKEETIGHLMMGKEDNVVFCAMSELQKRVYKRTLQLPDIQTLVNKDLPCSCGSPLKQVECCKRTVPDGFIWPYLHRDNPEGCDSCPFCLILPCLVKLQQISNHLELIKPNSKDDKDKQKKDAEFATAVFGADVDLVGGSIQNDSFMGVSDVRHCGKMGTLGRLMQSWISKGDKILLFSYSVRMLDILEKFIIRKGYCFARLDGSTPTCLRQSVVDDFNSSPSKQVFLISTRAGGLGLNLVSANRVVIFDPNWNPAQDLQAQDRSFRFGQKRHVTVFRLLAAGSLEELVYTRQIYKQQLSNVAVSGKIEKRYFEGVQDCKEFKGELFGICNLFRDLSNKLFTSDIVEFHEKDGKESDHNHCAKLDLTDLGIHFDPSEEEIAARHSAGAATKETNGDEQARVDPMLKDFGVVYAHRNEDIVNIRSRILVEAEPSTSASADDKDQSRSSYDKEARESHEESNEKDDNPQDLDSSKRRKHDHYSFLALFMGMEEAQLRKLLSSDVPNQVHKNEDEIPKG